MLPEPSVSFCATRLSKVIILQDTINECSHILVLVFTAGRVARPAPFFKACPFSRELFHYLTKSISF